MPVSRICKARSSHDRRTHGVGRGLEVSLCGLRQDQLVQRQIRHRSPKTIVLSLQLLQPLHLIALQAAILIPPSIVRDYSPKRRRLLICYDSKGNLISVTYPGGSKRQYLYEVASLPNALTGIIDENGAHYATWAYNAQGRAISSQHAGGADLTTLTYNANGSTTVTDARGNVHAYGLTTQFGLVKPTALTGAPVQTSGGKAFTYDANGFMAGRTDRTEISQPIPMTYGAMRHHASRLQAHRWREQLAPIGFRPSTCRRKSPSQTGVRLSPMTRTAIF